MDAWVAAYLANRIESILLWAPTQLHHPDHDLAAGLPRPGKLFVLENKAPYTGIRGGHGFELSVRQLHNYLSNPRLRPRTFYVLPCPPFGQADVPEPSRAPPSQPALLDRRALTRLPGHPWAPPGGAEEWFRVISATDLWQALFGLPHSPIGAGWRSVAEGPPSGRPSEVTLSCPECLALPGWSLEAFVDEIRACGIPALRIHPGEPEPVVAPKVRSGRTLDTALAAFAPAAALPGW